MRIRTLTLFALNTWFANISFNTAFSWALIALNSWAVLPCGLGRQAGSCPSLGLTFPFPPLPLELDKSTGFLPGAAVSLLSLFSGAGGHSSWLLVQIAATVSSGLKREAGLPFVSFAPAAVPHV